MEQTNGHVDAKCPFSGESELKVDINNGNGKSMKPNLRIKVPQPIKLKNHLETTENFDSLYSRIEDVKGLVSNFTFSLLN